MTNSRGWILYIVGVVGLGIIYHLAARLGLLMANVQPNTSPVWPPAGIALAALLLFGIRYWPGIALGLVFGFLFNNTPLPVSIGLAIGNSLEAVVAVYLLKRYAHFRNSLDRIQDVIGLTLAGAFATAISATVGVITLLLAGNNIQPVIWTVWYTWWIGDFLGALVIAPFLLVWFTQWPVSLSLRRIAEGLAVLLLLLVVTSYVFTNQTIGSVTHEALIYVLFPFVIYATLRFTQLGAVSAVTLVSGIAIFGTATGSGPLVRSTLNDSLIILQTFMGVVTLTALTLAATTRQRQTAEEALQHRVEDLAKLNDASSTFLGTFDTQSVYEMVCRLAVEKFGLSSAWIELITRDRENDPAIAVPYGMTENQILVIKSAMQVQPASREVPEASIYQFSTQTATGSVASFPLKLAGKSIGQLALLSLDPNFFTLDRMILLDSYANLAAVAIQNTWSLDQVRSGNERLHALSHRLMEVQESERLHLSRELHDESGQVLSAMLVQLGLLERDVDSPELIRKHADELKHIASDVLSNLHEMAVRLRPASLDHLGLVKSLEQYISEFSAQHRLDVQFDSVGFLGKRYPIEIETALFRVIQESLTNVLLHAQATRVDVVLSQRKKTLNVIVEDNGVGFIPESMAKQARLGLFGMRERVEMLGGKLTIESEIGKGTTIQAEVPCGG